MRKRTLLLNSDYLPFSCISWKRAIVLSFIAEEIPEEGAQIIECYPNEFIRSGAGIKHPIPAIARLNRYVVRSGRRVPFSRKNVFIRDDLTCQYCLKRFPANELTYDHVISRHEWREKKMKGTPTRWDNIVTACRPCNHYKGNATLAKCGMTLRKMPSIPDPHKFVSGLTPWHSNIPDLWLPYLKPIYPNMFS